ncbi:MAG: DegQ family serine endoprotease [Proteobacteria bacterium]|nr:DegQ family serine endoprotease [Pseudomonadota bacterium]
MKFFKTVISLFVILFPLISNSVTLPNFTELAENQGKTVVNITSIKNTMIQPGNTPPFPYDEHLQEFFKRFGIPGFPGGIPPNGNTPQEKQVIGTGSGFIIDTKGIVITNAHVVNDADTVIVKLSDQREIQAEVLGVDKRTDVAVLKIKADNLPKVNIGDPSKLKVGEWVAAIGSPFGLESTMTVGIVSALGRNLPQENYVPFIQTDVAINPGNSGGPLFNTFGEVVGINSQIYSRTGGYMGLSFAIPIDVAIDVAEQLQKDGKVSRGWLGIAIQEISKELSESFGMKTTQGALVAGVEKESPADKGGLKPGDVVIKFNEKDIKISSDLPKFVSATKPNTKASVAILRQGKEQSLSITIGEMPTDEMVVARKNPDQIQKNRIGLVVKDLTPQQKKQIKENTGVIVVESADASLNAGIRKGDVILGLNNNPITSAQSFNQAVQKIAKGKTIALLVYRNGDTLYVPIKITN